MTLAALQEKEPKLQSKAYIKVYGCQMNEQDALHMKGLLTKMGYAQTMSPLEANMILLVSCSIREKALQKIYSDLGRIRLMLEDNPDLIVGLSGCVAQQEKESLAKRFPFLDMVFGPDAIRHLPEMLNQVQATKGKRGHHSLVNTKFDSRQDFAFVNLITEDEENRVKAFVNIQKGCDNVCSFCIVPRVRGPEVSRSSHEIIDEIKQLVDLGVKEVTLLGQNVNSYGLKDTREITFAELLEKVLTETGLTRLRFTTSHPKDVGDDLVDKFKRFPVLSSFFHLPVQSGSNSILKAMRRGYTREHYLTLVDKLREARPDMALSTDLIIGFPGETEKDFEETLNLVKEVSFDFSFSFIYSPRPGTRAIRLQDDVPLAEKVKRLKILQDTQREVALKKHRMLEGTYQEVLVESWDPLQKQYFGRTGTNKIVHCSLTQQSRISLLSKIFVPSAQEIFRKRLMEQTDFSGREDDLLGELIDVKIIKANAYSLVGEVRL